MLEELTKLADFLDENGLGRQANIVDAFIVRSQMMEETWVEDDTMPGQQRFQTPAIQEYRTNNKLELSDGVYLDLQSNPLGQKLVDFVKNIFWIADTGKESTAEEGIISAKALQDIVQTALRYDENLNVYPTMDENPNPLTSIQLQKIIYDIVVLYTKTYRAVDVIEPDTVRELINTLVQMYNDVYLEDYLNLENSETAYPASGGFPPSYQSPELSEVQKNKLWEAEDLRLEDANQQSWLENTEREVKPETHQQRQQIISDKLKRDFPEKWHSILFDK